MRSTLSKFVRRTPLARSTRQGRSSHLSSSATSPLRVFSDRHLRVSSGSATDGRRPCASLSRPIPALLHHIQHQCTAVQELVKVCDPNYSVVKGLEVQDILTKLMEASDTKKVFAKIKTNVVHP